MDIIEKIYPTGRISGSNYIFTPQNIVEDMINMLPDDFWTPDKKILDIYTKSGRFLKEAFKRLYNSPYLADMDIAKRKRHILTEQLFGLTDDFTCLLLSERMLYGYAQYGKKHIKMIKNMIPFVQSQDHKFINNLLEKEFDTMKFDLVIGNPPYNKGMDLDFVDLGYKISDQYTVMITPAKWQTTADDYIGCASKNLDYKQFRELYVPHMSHVVFYPDCKDIFNIGQIDGTTYFMLNKIKNDECIIENKCQIQKYFNSVQKRSICSRESLNNIGNDIWQHLKKQSSYKPFELQKDPEGRYEIWTNTQMASGSRGGMTSCLLTVDGSSQFIGVSRLRDKHTDAKPDSSTAKVVFASDNELESKSFLSWIDSKLVRFMLAINISKLSNIMCNNFFRFVPAPPSGKFDHIYTDKELYKAFNLPQKYIDVIEAVVKERK